MKRRKKKIVKDTMTALIDLVNRVLEDLEKRKK